MLCRCGYYPAPVIECIWPATLPRYGSYPAWIILQDGLSAVLNTTVRSQDAFRILTMHVAAASPLVSSPSASISTQTGSHAARPASPQPCSEPRLRLRCRRTCKAQCWTNYSACPSTELLCWAQVASFEPVVRILGAGKGGSYLDLPANLTANDREVAFTMPEQSKPLPAGSFVVQLSLNGGADFSGGPPPLEQVRFILGLGKGSSQTQGQTRQVSVC